MKVHVILKESGEYSERDFQLVGVFSDESAAQDLIAQKTAENRAAMVRYGAWQAAVQQMHADFREKYGWYIFEGGLQAREAVAAFDARYGERPPGDREENYTLVTTDIDEVIP